MVRHPQFCGEINHKASILLCTDTPCCFLVIQHALLIRTDEALQRLLAANE